MKATIKQVVECYRALGEARVTKLEESEVIKVLKARKAMRKVVEDYDAFLKDVLDKFKPEGFDRYVEVYNAVRGKVKEGEKYLPDPEEAEAVKAVMEYDRKASLAINDEQSREVELEVEPLKEESATRILLENGWEIGRLDLLEIVM